MPTQIELEAFSAVREFASRCSVPIIQELRDGAGIYGTGTLYKDGNGHYLITAKHVAEDIEELRLGIPLRFGGSEVWFPGNGNITYSETADVAAYRLDSAELVEKLKVGWTFIDNDYVWSGALPERCAFLLYGFPGDLAKTSGEVLHAPPTSYVTSLYVGTPVGLATAYDPSIDIFLKHQTRGIRHESGLVERVPDLPGISGCAVWAVTDPEINLVGLWAIPNNVRIVAVQTSYVSDHWIRTRKWGVVDQALSKLRDQPVAL